MATPHTSHTETTETTVPGRPVYDDINVTTIFMVGICSTIITVLIVAFVQGLCYHWESGVYNARLHDRASRAIRENIEAQRASLATAEEEGRIGIDEAMRRVVERYGRPGGNPSDQEADGPVGETGH